MAGAQPKTINDEAGARRQVQGAMVARTPRGVDAPATIRRNEAVQPPGSPPLAMMKSATSRTPTPFLMLAMT